MKDPQQIVNALMWVVIAGLGFAILCTIIYYMVYRKRLPCIEDEYRKLKPKDVDGLQLVSTPMGHDNVFMKMYKEGREPPPTIRECVKICEENPEVCEILAYLQKEKEKEKMNNNEMPELQFGDVVKYNDNEYGIVTKTRVYDLVCTDGYVSPCDEYLEKANVQRTPLVERVYRRGACGFDQSLLRGIYEGYGDGWVIWERPKVVEMTVNQVSDALGYEVKIVGEKHA